MIYPPPSRIAAIVALEPDAQCHVFEEPDGTYRVEWLDDSITQPSKSAIDAKYNELVAAEPLNRVREERDRRLAETDYWALAAHVLSLATHFSSLAIICSSIQPVIDR